MLRHIDQEHQHYDCPITYCPQKWTNRFSRPNHLLEHLRAYHKWDIPKKRKPEEDEALDSLRQKNAEIAAENGLLSEKIKVLEQKVSELEPMNEHLERRVRVLCDAVTTIMRLDDGSSAAAE